MSVRNAAWVGLVPLVVGSLVLGAFVTQAPWIAIGFSAAVVAVWGAYEERTRPVLAGVVFLGYMNALPFIDLHALVLPAGLRYDDIAMITLFGLAAIWTARVKRGSPVWRLRSILVAVCLYWAFVVAQTVLTGGGTLMMSLLYGRDLLAIVMSLAFAYAATTERDLSAFLAVVVTVACLYSIAHLAQTFVGLDTSLITHPYKTSVSGTASRLFFRAAHMMPSLLLVCIGQALTSSSKRRSAYYWAGALILALDVLGQFTRANYLAMIVAFLVGAALFGRLRSDQPRSRAAVAMMVASLLAIGSWIVTGSRRILGRFASSSVGARLFSAGSDIATQGGTFGYRLTTYQTMLSVLGARWVTGLGFWHPGEHYVAVLPQGAIRNSDTGILGILMTMGVVGVVMMVWPLIWVTRLAIASFDAERAWIRAVSWATVCYMAWVATTLFSLGYLSEGSGLASTGLIVGFMAGARQAEELTW